MEITPNVVQGNKQHKQHSGFSVHFIFSPLRHNSKLSKLLKKTAKLDLIRLIQCKIEHHSIYYVLIKCMLKAFTHLVPKPLDRWI